VLTVNYITITANPPISLSSSAYIDFIPVNPYLQKSFSMKFDFEGSTVVTLGDFFIIIFPTFDTGMFVFFIHCRRLIKFALFKGFFPSDDGIGFELI